MWSDFKYGDAVEYALADYAKTQGKGDEGFKEIVNKSRPDLNGFILFDEQNRVRVDLPKGW